MKPYPTWKFVLLALVALVGLVYASPNLFGDDPAVQVVLDSGGAPPATVGETIATALNDAGIDAVSNQAEGDQWVVRFASADDQLEAADILRPALGRGYGVALNLAPKTPDWLQGLGARPMNLGLDLRGGVHFLLEVDVDDIRAKAKDRYLNDLPAFLRRENIRYSGRRAVADGVELEFPDTERAEAARSAIVDEFPEIELTPSPDDPLKLSVQLSEAEAKRLVDFAVRQNLTTLRNRVNQLGVAEPVVQRQGEARIVVQLPGVQDTSRVKDLLGATATLE